MPKQIRLFVTSSLLAMTLLVAADLVQQYGDDPGGPRSPNPHAVDQADAIG